MLTTGSFGRRLALLAVGGLLLFATAGSSADSFSVNLVSQTSNTITLGWSPQPGYGYLFSAGGILVSRTNDPNRTSVKFSKVAAGTYDIDVITKGANGHYPGAPPPPPKAQCEDGVDNDADGKVDFPSDPGCSSATDNDETNVVTPPPPTGFPDASNTGVPPGTTLTAYTGPSTISTPGTVITGKTIGCININTTGVIIRNSRISGNCGYAVVNVDDRAVTSTAVTIEDSEISCNNSGANGIAEADITLRRVEITQCENGGDLNQNILVEDSFIHNLTIGGHEDGFQCAAGHYVGSTVVDGALNLTFRHNTIYGMGNGDTDFGTSSIICGLTHNVNIVIESNLLGGGAYTVYCPGNGTSGNNFRLTNNRFTTRFSPKVGAFGPSDGCSNEALSGNAYFETGLPISLS